MREAKGVHFEATRLAITLQAVVLAASTHACPLRALTGMGTSLRAVARCGVCSLCQGFGLFCFLKGHWMTFCFEFNVSAAAMSLGIANEVLLFIVRWMRLVSERMIVEWLGYSGSCLERNWLYVRRELRSFSEGRTGVGIKMDLSSIDDNLSGISHL